MALALERNQMNECCDEAKTCMQPAGEDVGGLSWAGRTASPPRPSFLTPASCVQSSLEGCTFEEMAAANEFYMRYYTGHKGKFGHEFLEFEFRPDGKMRYANNSNYKNDTMIRKEVFVNEGIIEALKKIVKDSDIMKEDDRNWPMPDKVGRQELEIVMGNEHISFTTTKIGSLLDVEDSKDPEGLRVFYYLIQDLKCFVFSICQMHFKIKPI